MAARSSATATTPGLLCGGATNDHPMVRRGESGPSRGRPSRRTIHSLESVRYAGFVAPRPSFSRRYPGLRRRHPAACNLVRDVSLLKEVLCRTVAIRGRNSRRRSRKSRLTLKLKSSNAQITPMDSLCSTMLGRRAHNCRLNRCRRLARDWENLNRKALALLRLASIRLMLRKLCNPA